MELSFSIFFCLVGHWWVVGLIVAANAHRASCEIRNKHYLD